MVVQTIPTNLLQTEFEWEKDLERIPSSQSGQMHLDPPDDTLGRSFQKLRLSLTPTCNFNCSYCEPAANTLANRKFQAPTFYLKKIKRILKVNPLRQIRLTGGEPTLYPYLTHIIKQIKALAIERVSLTSNGYRLEKLAPHLKEAGLDDVNVSLDAMQPGAFKIMSGRPPGLLAHIKAGLLICADQGIHTKINCTVLRGQNDDQILPLVEFATSHNIEIRFLEFMRMGPVRGQHDSLFVPAAEILSKIHKQFKLIPTGRSAHETSIMYQTRKGNRVGVIANHSRSFCDDCNRLRMDHLGQLYGCLSTNQGLSIPESSAALRKVLCLALEQKQTQSFTGSALSMQAIGG